MKKWGISLFIFLGTVLVNYAQSESNDDAFSDKAKLYTSDYFLTVTNLIKTLRNSGTEKFSEDIKIAQSNFAKTSDSYSSLEVLGILSPIVDYHFDDASRQLEELDQKFRNEELPLTLFSLNFIRAKTYLYRSQFRNAIDYYEKCVLEMKRDHRLKETFSEVVNGPLANSKLKLGHYEEALEIYYKELELSQSDKALAIAYNNIAICYHNLKQFQKAEEYYIKSIEISTSTDKINHSANLSILYIDLREFDKATTVIEEIESLMESPNDTLYIYSVRADLEKHKGNYQKSLAYFDRVIEIDKRKKNYAALANDYLAIGSMYLQKGEHLNAERYYEKSQSILDTIEDQNAQVELLESRLENKLAKAGDQHGLEIFDQYIDLLDEINSDELKAVSEEMHVRYQSAEKEALIATQKLQLKKEVFQRQLILIGIGLSVLMLGVVFFWLRSRHRRKELQKENSLLALERELNRLELNSLNNQLDPHEIKNLLASISPQIQEKAPEAYQKMLKLFNITKAGLQNDTLTDSLSNQLKQASDYLDLMKDTLWEPLEYEIQNHISHCEEVLIPRLLLKNLVENSVKHGIKGKEGGGKIEVQVRKENNFFSINVKDNGNGLQTNNKSDSQLGISTYQKLFEVLNKRNKTRARLVIVDQPEGFEVAIKIPVNYQYN